MKTGQTTLEQAKTVLLMSRILLQATKARLRYKLPASSLVLQRCFLASLTVLLVSEHPNMKAMSVLKLITYFLADFSRLLFVLRYRVSVPSLHKESADSLDMYR